VVLAVVTTALRSVSVCSRPRCRESRRADQRRCGTRRSRVRGTVELRRRLQG